MRRLRGRTASAIILSIGFAASGCATGPEVQTPVPSGGVTIKAPGADVPPHAAAFSGVWAGELDPIPRPGGPYRALRDYHTLVVQTIEQEPDSPGLYRVTALWSSVSGYFTPKGLIYPDGTLMFTIHDGNNTYLNVYTLAPDGQSLAVQFSSDFLPDRRPKTLRRGVLQRQDMFPK